MRAPWWISLAWLVGCPSPEESDVDGDGLVGAEDCNPGVAVAAETCNGLDDDCNGVADDITEGGTVFYADADFDGFGAGESTTACAAPPGYVVNDQDCDDADPAIHPGAAEPDCADLTDYNCDGSAGVADHDQDGVAACQGDCDDADPSLSPGVPELCDGRDQDCDGSIDDDPVDAEVYAMDIDGDGHGNPNYQVASCDPLPGYVEADEADDCDDLSPVTYPGAREACDGLDNNCNGKFDDGATGQLPWYADADGDGFGDVNTEVSACVAPAGHVSNFDDCDDADGETFPGAEETCGDNTDRNCDGAVGQDDGDGDGVPACDDCDDTRSDIKPGATELCDGVDNDCDGKADELAPTWFADLDGDGQGGDRASVTQCDAPPGWVATSTDCDDLDASVFVGAAEACDGVDTNCDGTAGATETDVDADGWLACAGDCDDRDATERPDAVELCDGSDDDCDGAIDEASAADAATWYGDVDGDGYGSFAKTASGCGAPTGYVGNTRDCNDSAAAVNPAAAETCNSVDDDCDGDIDEPSATDAKAWYADGDGDGAGSKASVIACSAPAGFVATGNDCNDGDATRKPGATELCNGVDDDCNGAVPANEADADLDGFRNGCAAAGKNDCNDAVATINPSGVEVCNGADDDCDGTPDDSATDAALFYKDADNDKYGLIGTTARYCSLPASGWAAVPGDCLDTNSGAYPGATEKCNSVDDDCDGDIDESSASDASKFYVDSDGDGYGGKASTVACAAPTGFVSSNTDCDDANAARKPGATEACNGLDDDCNGAVPVNEADADLDGFRNGCAATGKNDCNDNAVAVNPSATEVCNSADDDCDGTIDEVVAGNMAADAIVYYRDADGDTYGVGSQFKYSCAASEAGYSAKSADCNDGAAGTNPGATETCDGVDQDCDGIVDDGQKGGGRATCAADSCRAIQVANATAPNGMYWISRSVVGPTRMYCDMTGGGWTEVAYWDPDGGIDLRGVWEETYNSMTDYTDFDSYLRWSDYDSTSDVIVFDAPVDFVNGGETKAEIHLDGVSYEDTATYLYAVAGGTTRNLVCSETPAVSTPNYTAAEVAYKPYTCATNQANFTWNGTYTGSYGTAITAMSLRSFHYDGGLGDYTNFYRMRLWVR